MEPIDPETYAISEYGHWEQVHSYLVIGDISAALIDTGLAIGDIRGVVGRLTSLPIQVVTTHVHYDHIGGHGAFSDIAVHQDDAAWLEAGIPLPVERIRAQLMKEPLRKLAPAGFDPSQYMSYRGTPSKILVDGDVIDLGNRRLRVFHTPGHCPGHICFHEAERGYLFTGDLLYQGTLFAYYPSTDPRAFAASIARIRKLEPVARLLPGHNALELPADLRETVHQAFCQLADQGLLQHGTGVHTFESCSIHL